MLIERTPKSVSNQKHNLNNGHPWLMLEGMSTEGTLLVLTIFFNSERVVAIGWLVVVWMDCVLRLMTLLSGPR
jgi:hypothetical protein